MATLTQGTLRVTHFAGGYQVTILNCENAGKRGKVCEKITVAIGPTLNWNNRGQLFCDLLHNLSIKVDQITSWEDALAFAEEAKIMGYELHTWQEKAIRVAPLGFEEVTVGNDNYGAGAGFEDFSARCKRDKNNEPTWISTSDQKKADFKKVYDFMRKNKEMLSAPEITFHKFISLVKDHTGVYGHSYCAMD